MAKLAHLSAVILLLTSLTGWCQSYPVHYHSVEPDSSVPSLLTHVFSSRNEAKGYINGLPSLLQGKGYLGASVDSLVMDSASAQVWIYVGDRFHWALIRTRAADRGILQSVPLPPEALHGNMEV